MEIFVHRRDANKIEEGFDVAQLPELLQDAQCIEETLYWEAQPLKRDRSTDP